jgi:superfamily II DNA or RNA helicase
VIVLPTGSGKTRVAVAVLAELRCGALCLVPTRLLLEQWHGVLCTALGGPVGRYGDGLRELEAVTVATFESAFRHMGELGSRFPLLVVDEAHHFGAGARDEALEMSLAPWRLGLTATPGRGAAEARLAELLGPVVFELAIGDLAGGFLADFELIELGLTLNADERAEHDRHWSVFAAVMERFRDIAPSGSWADFARWAARFPEGRTAMAAWRAAARLLALKEAKREVVGALLGRCRDARTLIFTSSKEAAYAIAKEHLIMPITADIGRGEREAALEDFRAGRIRALVSARVLNEGVDVPEAEVGILVGGVQGEREFVQRIGRLLRPAPEKRARVYDLVTRDTIEVRQARRKRRGLEQRRPQPV